MYATVAYTLIVFGVIVAVIAFLGCCGAMKESQCMLGAVSMFQTIFVLSLKKADYYTVYTCICVCLHISVCVKR